MIGVPEYQWYLGAGCGYSTTWKEVASPFSRTNGCDPLGAGPGEHNCIYLPRSLPGPAFAGWVLGLRTDSGVDIGP